MSRPAFRLPSPAMVVALLALFVALGGAAIAATGGAFILGQPNSATSTTSLDASLPSAPTLSSSNTATGPAASFTAPSGTPALSISNTARIPNLNADLLDGVDSGALLRNSAGAVGTTQLADGAVTQRKLNQSLVHRIDVNYTLTSSSDALSNFYDFGALRISLLCNSSGMDMAATNLGPTTASFNAVWIAYSTATAHNHSLGLAHFGSDQFIPHTPAGGTGTILFRLPGETITGDFTFFSNGFTCEFYTNLLRLT